jgi:hypothetical protein
VRALPRDIGSGVFLRNLGRKPALARDRNLVAFFRGSSAERVVRLQGVREPTVEITFLEVENSFLSVRNVLGEEVVEVVGFQGEEDTPTVGKTGCKEQVEQEAAEATGLADGGGGRRWRGLRACN